MRVLPLFAALIALSFQTGCPKSLGKLGCQSVRDCDVGETCQDGSCIGGGASSCIVDTDCNVGLGEVCNPLTGACGQGTPVSGCLATSECPIDQFCNTSTGLCAVLAPGFCRNAGQCSAEAAVCSAQSESVPGRCVQCLVPEDCAAGQQCVNPGVCSGEGTQCPPNSTLGAGGACFCNPGFSDDGNGGCVVVQAGGEGEGEPAGEGEGEGEPPQGDACPSGVLGALVCLNAGAYNSCGDDGFCTCNQLQLFATCVIDDDPNNELDMTNCACVHLRTLP